MQSVKNPAQTISKWLENTNSESEVDKVIREHVKQQTLIANTRPKSYSYNFLQRNIPYKVRLHKMQIKESPNSIVCGLKEDLMHLYWRCTSTRRLWERLNQLIQMHMKTYFIESPEKLITTICFLGEVI